MQSMFYAMLTLARGYTVALDSGLPREAGEQGGRGARWVVALEEN